LISLKNFFLFLFFIFYFLIKRNHPATEEIKYRLKHGHGKKEEKPVETVDSNGKYLLNKLLVI